ncbi:hypothetical protein [Actinoplanes sp. OR16]|uniref:hypothetical protein n=1 Tax=Actinoplanes sp. OR16 TaxID=946334 RepID=UPI000FDB8E7C|nr:hypothetical protein [Actinoplanes sp. OR16]
MSVFAEAVASDGFRAQTGREVTLALSAYCLYRRRDGAAEPGELDGVVVPPVRESMFGGWVFTTGGVPFHVLESSFPPDPPRRQPGDHHRLAGSDPEEPVPAAGSRVRMRAGLSVADGFVADEVRDGWGIDLDRTWLVERIVRQGGDPVAAIEWSPRPIDYLIDIVRS